MAYPDTKMCKVGRGYATEKRRETFQLGLIIGTKGWKDVQ